MNRGAFVLITAAVAAAPRPGGAQNLTTTAALSRLFGSSDPQAAWFSTAFIAAVPLTKVRSINLEIVSALGAYRSVVPNGDGYTLTFAHGTLQADATIDGTGAFTALFVHGMQSEAIATRLASLLKTDPIPAIWFSDTFLAQVPIDQIRSGIKGLLTQFGAFASLTALPDGSYNVTFAKGSVNSTMSFSGDGKINAVTFAPPPPAPTPKS